MSALVFCWLNTTWYCNSCKGKHSTPAYSLLIGIRLTQFAVLCYFVSYMRIKQCVINGALLEKQLFLFLLFLFNSCNIKQKHFLLITCKQRLFRGFTKWIWRLRGPWRSPAGEAQSRRQAFSPEVKPTSSIHKRKTCRYFWASFFFLFFFSFSCFLWGQEKAGHHTGTWINPTTTGKVTYALTCTYNVPWRWFLHVVNFSVLVLKKKGARFV